MGESTNQYVKLANLWMDRQTNQMGYDNLAVDSLVDPWDYCQKAVELFGLYKRCATPETRNRKGCFPQRISVSLPCVLMALSIYIGR